MPQVLQNILSAMRRSGISPSSSLMSLAFSTISAWPQALQWATKSDGKFSKSLRINGGAVMA